MVVGGVGGRGVDTGYRTRSNLTLLKKQIAKMRNGIRIGNNVHAYGVNYRRLSVRRSTVNPNTNIATFIERVHLLRARNLFLLPSLTGN